MSEAVARLLDLLAEQMPREEVEAVYAFPPVRREGKEHGVAVISRLAPGDRRVLYRARLVVGLRGAERGKVAVAVEETAEGPPSLLPEVLDGVRRRADEAGDAELVDLTAWKAGEGEHPTTG